MIANLNALAAFGFRAFLVSIFVFQVALATVHAQDQCRVHRLSGSVESVAISRDGRRYAFSVSTHRHIYLYDTERGVKDTRFGRVLGHNDAMIFSPDGKLFASQLLATDEKGIPYLAVRIWNIRSGERFAEFNLDARLIVTLALSPDEQRLAVGERNGVVRLWSIPKQKLQTTLEDHSGSVCMTFSEDSKYLVTAGMDGSVRLWDARTGKPVHSVLTATGRYLAIQCSSNNQQVYVASLDGKLDVFEAPTLRLLRIVPLKGVDPQLGLTGATMAVAPNCRWVAAGLKSAIMVWDAETGKTIATLHHKKDYFVKHLCFAEEGNLLISGAADFKFEDESEIILWRIKPN